MEMYPEWAYISIKFSTRAFEQHEHVGVYLQRKLIYVERKFILKELKRLFCIAYNIHLDFIF